MIHEIQFALAPEQAFDAVLLREILTHELGVTSERLSGWKIRKRSIDARSRNVKVNLRIEAYVDEPVPGSGISWEPRDVSKKPSVIIIGAGPAGLFAALRLIELGLKPIILERGKDVQKRRRDLAALNKDHIVDPDSN